MLIWTALYICLCLFYKWLISPTILDRLSFWDWTPEQNKFYILIIWFFSTFVFVYGLFNSDFRRAFLLDYLF